MYSFILTLQLFLMLPALPLALMSHRTSRAHRSRHGSFLAVASLLATLAAMLGLISLSVAIAGVEEQDWLLSFGPPVITLLACGFVIRRGLSPVRSRSRRPRSADGDARGGARGGDPSTFQSSLHSGYQASTLGSRHSPADAEEADTADTAGAPR